MNASQNNLSAATARMVHNNSHGFTTIGPSTYGISADSLNLKQFTNTGTIQPSGVYPSDKGPFPGFEDDRSYSN